MGQGGQGPDTGHTMTCLGQHKLPSHMQQGGGDDPGPRRAVVQPLGRGPVIMPLDGDGEAGGGGVGDGPTALLGTWAKACPKAKGAVPAAEQWW
jgi:hypothetical protein